MKDEATPEMKMAQRIADQLYGEHARGGMCHGSAQAGALAAIIETQRLVSSVLESERVEIDAGAPNEIDVECNNLIDRCLETIRAGHHYGKGEI